MPESMPKPFVPEDNPYDALDRGLFIARELMHQTSDIDVNREDTYCRISRIEVYNFQGMSNYCIIGYQVMIFPYQPVTEEDYAKGQIYKDPRGLLGVDKYYFQNAPQHMSSQMVENLCITDFIQNVRILKQSAWPTFKSLYAPFQLAKDTLQITEGKLEGVDLSLIHI